MKKNLKKYWLKNITNNKLLLLVVLFFIIWKFFLIHTMWHNRNIVPEPDDSFIYIAHINSVIQCPSFLFCKGPYSLHNFGGWEHLSYRLFFGSIGKLLHLTATQVYHYSFYIGTLLLIPILIYFIQTLTKNKRLVALILFFLALYNGAGSYHGFFWVVPTFFSVLLFFLIFNIILNNKIKYWLFTLPILSLLSAFNHIISIYACSIFVIYFIILALTSKKIDWLVLKKIILVVLFTLLPYFYITFILHNNPYQVSNLTAVTKSSHNSSHQVSNLTAVTNSSHNSSHQVSNANLLLNLFPGLLLFKTEYLNWLFPNLIGILIFILVITPIIIFKKYKIIYIYLSVLTFSLISMKSIYGVRSLIYLWPITFILYAYGTYYGFKFIDTLKFNKKVIKLLKICLFLGVLFFSILNLSYSYLSNQERNSTRRILIPSSFFLFLNKHTQSELNCTTGIIGMHPNNKNNPLQINFCQGNNLNAKYFLTIHEHFHQSTLQKIIAKLKNHPLQENKQIIYDKKIPANFILEKRLGDILIYKKTINSLCVE